MIAPYRSWLEPDALDPTTGDLLLTVQSLSGANSGHHTILIDTCVGYRKSYDGIPSWRDEVAASVDAASPVFRENVQPVIDAKQAVLVDTGYALDDEVWLEPTVGRTAGHVAFI